MRGGIFTSNETSVSLDGGGQGGAGGTEKNSNMSKFI